MSRPYAPTLAAFGLVLTPHTHDRLCQLYTSRTSTSSSSYTIVGSGKRR